MKSLTIPIFVMLLAGCGTQQPYVSPAPGPDTASVRLEYSHPRHDPAFTFEDPKACRGPQFIGRWADNALSYDIHVKAGTATVNMGYSALGAGSINSCNVLSSFEAKSGAKYRLRFSINDKGGCDMSLVEEAADGLRNRSNLLVKRTFSPPLAPSLDPKARLLCSDTYTPR